MKPKYYILMASFFLWMACGKKNSSLPQSFALTFLVNGSNNGTLNYAGLNLVPVIRFSFSSPVQSANIGSAFTLIDKSNTPVSVSTQLMSNDSIVIVKPSSVLKGFSSYTLSVSSGLLSSTKGTLTNPITIHLQTGIDSSDKFPQITDSALLTLVQQQTFKYFWDFGHPVSGLARERDNGDNEVVTTGGSGFGIMAIIVAANRGFITRADAVSRLNTILNFLITKCQRWHGAFSHWINGSTGATVAFGTNNGADIVETSYLLQGLLTARQYFNNLSDVNETALRDSVNSIWNAVEWKWFTQNGSTSSMYWQYNPSYTANADIWSIPVNGWNEALITYALAASSPNYSISKGVYDTGWSRNGAMVNGNAYYGISLPLGESYGGPLFFAHYSFLGINPNSLSDAYANYWTQNVSHAKINYAYCVANPQNYYGYSNLCWGLTASDIQNGYTAASPTNDVGVIAPTAAISSMPYTPTESMNALRFFYYKLGDKVWGQYGFVDAFKLSSPWFDNDYLAIDQGPQIVMIENYRTGLLWDLFMSCPEIKKGMKGLGFTSPNLN